MATVITIDWNDEDPKRGEPYPNPAPVEKQSCLIFVNKLDVDITINGESGLFKGNAAVLVAKDGGINAVQVTGAVGAGKQYSFDDGTGDLVPRQGTIDIS